MKPMLRRLHSPDTADLAAVHPSSASFAVLVQLLVGPDDGPGEESFDVVVCSPAWPAERPQPLVGRTVAEKVGRLGHWEFEDYRA